MTRACRVRCIQSSDSPQEGHRANPTETHCTQLDFDFLPVLPTCFPSNTPNSGQTDENQTSHFSKQSPKCHTTKTSPSSRASATPLSPPLRRLRKTSHPEPQIPPHHQTRHPHRRPHSASSPRRSNHNLPPLSLSPLTHPPPHSHRRRLPQRLRQLLSHGHRPRVQDGAPLLRLDPTAVLLPLAHG
jgi:hypothetical protein